MWSAVLMLWMAERRHWRALSYVTSLKSCGDVKVCTEHELLPSKLAWQWTHLYDGEGTAEELVIAAGGEMME